MANSTEIVPLNAKYQFDLKIEVEENKATPEEFLNHLVDEYKSPILISLPEKTMYCSHQSGFPNSFNDGVALLLAKQQGYLYFPQDPQKDTFEYDSFLQALSALVENLPDPEKEGLQKSLKKLGSYSSYFDKVTFQTGELGQILQGKVRPQNSELKEYRFLNSTLRLALALGFGKDHFGISRQSLETRIHTEFETAKSERVLTWLPIIQYCEENNADFRPGESRGEHILTVTHPGQNLISRPFSQKSQVKSVKELFHSTAAKKWAIETYLNLGSLPSDLVEEGAKFRKKYEKLEQLEQLFDKSRYLALNPANFKIVADDWSQDGAREKAILEGCSMPMVVLKDNLVRNW